MAAATHCGILNINKPPDMTSRRVVDAVQRLVRPAKAGHAGTLDPLATGVLVVCVGYATRLIPYVQAGEKEYRGEFQLGCRSNTDDLTGEVSVVQDARQPTLQDITAALPTFLGDVSQVPPQFSAVHVGGERAYKMARAGNEVKLEPRTVRIERIDVVEFDYPRLVLDITCGSGTYIRSVGRDLGEALGCGAAMSGLVRTRVGTSALEDAVELKDLTPENLAAHIQSPVTAVGHLPSYVCDSAETEHIQHGRAIRPRRGVDHLADDSIALLDQSGELLAIATVKGTTLAPKQVFRS